MKKFKSPICLILAVLLWCFLLAGCPNGSSSDGEENNPVKPAPVLFDVSLYKGKYDVSFSFDFLTIELTQTQLFVDDVAYSFTIVGETLLVTFSNFELRLFVEDDDLVCKLTDLTTGFSTFGICYPFVEPEPEDPFVPDPNEEEPEPEYPVDPEPEEPDDEQPNEPEDPIEPDPDPDDDPIVVEPNENFADFFVGSWFCGTYNLEIFYDGLQHFANFCGTLAVFVAHEDVSTFSINEPSKQTTYTVTILDAQTLKIVWDEFDYDTFEFFTIELHFSRV